MESKFNRKTRFPGKDQNLLANFRAGEKNVNANRRTRFPGGSDAQKILLLEKEESRIEDIPEEEAPAPSRLPLRINPPNAVSERPIPTTNTKSSQPDQLSSIQVGSPWMSYVSLRHLERGGQVTAAYTRKVPVHMVAVKKLLSDNFMELRKFPHENLLAIMEVYRFQGAFFIITDYTAATLKQVIAIPLTLEELHISATCRQVIPLCMFSDDLLTCLKVFEAMQHLSRFGMAHNKLDSSKVLFTPDGCVKLGTFYEITLWTLA
jgi:hypothetical protein